MTNEVILKVGTQEAVQNVRDLQDNIKALKEALKDETATAEDNAVVAEQLRKNQQALRDAMYATTVSTEDLIKSSKTLLDESGALNGSYNDLVHTMADLKAAWRASTDAVERSALGTEIDRINSRLKELDASTGNHSRNVGNYTKSITDAFSATAGGASKAINPIKSVKNGFMALSATPVIAILGLLANIITTIIEKLKSSEANVMAVTEAFSIFGVAGDMTTKIFQALGKAIGAVGDWLTKLLDKMGLVSDAMKERQAIVKEENALIKQQRENLQKNADDELRIAQLKQQAADKSQYTAEQRLAFLQEAANIEEAISKRTYEAAQREYEVIKRRNALTESSTEDLDKEAQAYANMVKAQTDYFNKTKELTGQMSEARTAMRAEAQSAAAAQKKELEERAKNERDTETKILEMRIALAEKGSQEELNLQLQKIQRAHALEVENANNTIKNKEQLQTTLLLLEQTYQQDVLNYQDAWYKVQEEKFFAEQDKRIEQTKARAQAEAEAEHQAMINRMNAFAEGSAEYLNAAIELARYELDTLHKQEEESNEAFYARQLEAEKKYNDSKKALADQRYQMTQAAVGGLSSLLGSLGDIYEQSAEQDKAAARKTKAIRIASAVIDTISGAVGAFMQSVKSTPPPMGAIIGGIQSAAVTAAGVANINKIKATNFDGSSANVPNVDAGSAVVSAPSIKMDVPQVNTIQSASDEERLNARAASQRVYIVQSDIEESGRRADVLNSEASF